MEYFGRIFWQELFGRNILGGLFGQAYFDWNILAEIFWV